MTILLAMVTKVLSITLLDLFLSGDNIGLIALATKNLNKKHAKKATLVGIGLAVMLRILFACSITLILKIQWLPIKFIGGLMLVKITWDFAKSGESKEAYKDKTVDGFWKAVGTIVIADAMMSLDNVLAIAGAAGGDIYLIIFGIALNIPIIFFGSKVFTNLLEKYTVTLYVGVAVLAHTAFKMILEDSFVYKYIKIPNTIIEWVPIVIAVAVMFYGIGKSRKRKK